MAYLRWIDNRTLDAIVWEVLEKAQKALDKVEENIGRNVLDPFSALFEMAGFGMSSGEEWIRAEKARQAQKTLTNQIGLFHQKILGAVSGWEDLKVGENIDLRHRNKKIVADIKNKFNTVNSSGLVSLYDNLSTLVLSKSSIYRGYTAYYVEIVPKPKGKQPVAYDLPFTPSDKTSGERRVASEKIRRIDGQSFYKLVTGEEDALYSLFRVLPKVIEKISSQKLAAKDLKMMDAIFHSAYLGKEDTA